MPVNKELFKQVYEQITKYPETHNQASWSDRPEDTLVGEGSYQACGATRCVAGWALHFYKPGQSIFKTALEIDPECHQDPLGPAAKILGIDPALADDLFLNSSDGEAVELVREYAGIEERS